MLSSNLKTPLVDWPCFLSRNTPNLHDRTIDKEYICKYIKISKIEAMLKPFISPVFPTTESYICIDVTRCWHVIIQSKNTLGGLAKFLSRNTLNLHDRCINKKIHFQG